MTMQSILIGVQRENLFSTITSVTAGQEGQSSASAEYMIIGGIERGTATEDFTIILQSEFDWLVPNNFGYNYEVRATKVSGGAAFSVGSTFDTFVDTNTNPSWVASDDISNMFPLSATGVIDFDFRRKGDTNILLTKRVELIASVRAPVSGIPAPGSSIGTA